VAIEKQRLETNFGKPKEEFEWASCKVAPWEKKQAIEKPAPGRAETPLIYWQHNLGSAKRCPKSAQNTRFAAPVTKGTGVIKGALGRASIGGGGQKRA